MATMEYSQDEDRKRELDTEVKPGAGDDSSISSSDVEVQAGVKRMEGIAQTWTGWGLTFAYVGIFLMAVATALESNSNFRFQYYATQAFAAAPLVSVIGVVQGVILSTVKPPMAKIGDVFGRTEAYCIAVVLFVLGWIQQAASSSVESFAAAQVFYSAGSTGVQVLQQIFVADITNLLNRALFSTLPDVPYLWSPFAASELVTDLVPDHWRWGYGLWAIVLPVCFLPLLVVLVMNDRKARRLGLSPARRIDVPIMPVIREKGWLRGIASIFATFGRGVKNFSLETDLFGLMLLAAAIALILLPIALAPLANGYWTNGSMIAMIVIGCILLPVFVFWERTPKLAPHAFFPKDLIKQPTVLAGCGISFFYFMAFYLSVFPYYLTYLRVVPQIGQKAAGNIISTFNFTSTVSSIVVSLIIKYTGHYKYFITAGACIYLLGMGLMVRYRQEDASIATLVGCQIAIGIGGGFLNVPAQLGVQASASHGQVAAATAIFLTILEVGGACGNAISGAIWSRYIPRKLAEYLPPDSYAAASQVFLTPDLIANYPKGTVERTAINRAYQETMTTLLTIATCMCVPIVLLSFVMKNYKLDQMDQKVKGRVIGGVEDTTEKSEGRDAVDPAAATTDSAELTKQRRGWPMSMFKR